VDLRHLQLENGVYVDYSKKGKIGKVAAVLVDCKQPVAWKSGNGHSEVDAITFGKEEFPGFTVYCDDKLSCQKAGAKYVNRSKNPAHTVARRAVESERRSLGKSTGPKIPDTELCSDRYRTAIAMIPNTCKAPLNRQLIAILGGFQVTVKRETKKERQVMLWLYCRLDNVFYFGRTVAPVSFRNGLKLQIVHGEGLERKPLPYESGTDFQQGMVKL
jgi:hypothetical protein